jgi:ribonuclease BN (tRNA processing enzyme)
MIKIKFLNHASIQIEVADFKLLSDPWFFGTCFQEGWGLKINNEKALEIITTSTHLWISHFHSDHFHIPTLKKILEVNPEIMVFGNDSYNFQLNKAMKGLGFKNIIPIYERKKITVNSKVEIIRYPATGIDNMLLIKTPYGNILNYNDCNLPTLTRKMIRKKIGPIDILATNFNHAGKLLNYPLSDPKVIKGKLKNSFKNNYDSFDAKYIFPFASHHYYRAPESKHQNLSLLSTEDLLSTDDKIININIGDTLTYNKEANEMSIQKGTVTENEMTFLERNDHRTIEELKTASLEYCRIVSKNYGFLYRFLPKFYIEISDLNQVVNLHPKKGIQLVESDSEIKPVIKANSDVIHKWFSTIYGTDSFVVGAHFEISNKDKIPIKWQIVFGILIDNQLSINNIIRMLFSLSGIKFLVNRREEIMGILIQRKIHADYHD